MILMNNKAIIKNVRERADRVRCTAMACWSISRDSVTLENHIRKRGKPL